MTQSQDSLAAIRVMELYVGGAFVAFCLLVSGIVCICKRLGRNYIKPCDRSGREQ